MTAILPLFVFPVDSAAGTKYEVESNNTYATADRTYDDYDNYGTMTTEGDVDWWKISFSSSGMANFWLGNIPSGCNFDMHVYKSDGTTQIVQGVHTSNHYELARCHVKANTTYYIKIVQKSGTSSSYYKLRAKNYAVRDTKVFTCNPEYTSGASYYVSPLYDDIYGSFSRLGFYHNGDYLNNTASDVYSVLTDTNIMVLYLEDCDDGYVTLHNGSKLYALENSDMTSKDKALSTFSGEPLAQTDLIIFAGPNTGGNTNSYGSLVDQARKKGAYIAIGWMTNVEMDYLQIWLERFFRYCSGGSVYTALASANKYMNTTYGEDEAYRVTYQEWGSSHLPSLVLDINY